LRLFWFGAVLHASALGVLPLAYPMN